MPDSFLRSSFQHLPGISSSKEKQLWAEGVFDWTDLLPGSPIQLDLYRKFSSTLEAEIDASERALADIDIAYFANRLPRREYYRIAAAFPDHCVFLDIETTGLSTYYDNVTIVGWSIGTQYRVSIDPSNMNPLITSLQQHPIIVTFNGARFDLPFLTKNFDTDWSAYFHIDLRYLARRVDLKGSQKKIELELGVERESSLVGISGPQAVELWFDYKYGDLSALRKLVRYNHADIEGMKLIFEEVISRLSLVQNPDFSAPLCFNKSRIPFSNTTSIDTDNAISIRPYTGSTIPRATLPDLYSANHRLRDVRIVGIDLTGSEKRRSGWAAVKGANVTTALLATDEDIIEATSTVEPFLVSIDSPLSLPRGRTSEYDDDPGRTQYGIVRQAERELRKRGIHVYPALLPSMQRLTQRGIEIASQLRKSGVPVIESYPGAAQDILGIPRKRTSLKHLLRGLRQYGFQFPANDKLISHDELDAVTSALVGQFMLAGYSEGLGSPDEDYLIVPTTDRHSVEFRVAIAIGISGRIASGKTTAGRFLERMGFQYERFSAVIEQEIKDAGRPVTRTELQALGERTHDSRFGQRRLQNKLASSFEKVDKLVVDGLRHPEDHAFLRERWGTAALHVHIDATEDLRCLRYTMNSRSSSQEFKDAETHSVEQNAGLMGDLSDVTISNNGSIEQLYGALVNLITGQSTCQ